MWDGVPTSVSILVPTRDTVYSHFSYSLGNLIKTTTQMGINVHLFFDASTILINQRERLIEQAIEVKSEWVLWLDSDMMFPSTTLLRLLAHNQDMVACNYMKRSHPFKSVTFMDTNDWESWVPIKSEDELLTVEATGMGCLSKKLNSLGYQLKIDMNLSNEIYHIGTFAYGKSLSANTQKKKEWESKRKKTK
jgi:hypothetical protein